MNHTKQVVTIADIDGWTCIEIRPSFKSDGWLSGMNPWPDRIVAIVEDFGGFDDQGRPVGIYRDAKESDYGFESLPNYLDSYDAIMGPISRLYRPAYLRFIDVLKTEFRYDFQSLLTITPKDLAKAFLMAHDRWENTTHEKAT